jgi:hypothetical protein
MLLIGLVTSFLLYRACILLGFAPSVMPGTLLNRLSVFCANAWIPFAPRR